MDTLSGLRLVDINMHVTCGISGNAVSQYKWLGTSLLWLKSLVVRSPGVRHPVQVRYIHDKHAMPGMSVFDHKSPPADYIEEVGFSLPTLEVVHSGHQGSRMHPLQFSLPVYLPPGTLRPQGYMSQRRREVQVESEAVSVGCRRVRRHCDLAPVRLPTSS